MSCFIFHVRVGGTGGASLAPMQNTIFAQHNYIWPTKLTSLWKVDVRRPFDSLHSMSLSILGRRGRSTRWQKVGRTAPDLVFAPKPPNPCNKNDGWEMIGGVVHRLYVISSRQCKLVFMLLGFRANHLNIAYLHNVSWRPHLPPKRSLVGHGSSQHKFINQYKHREE